MPATVDYKALYEAEEQKNRELRQALDKANLGQTVAVHHDSSYEAELAENRALRAQVHDLRAKVIKKLSEKHAAHELSLRQIQPAEHEHLDAAYQAELSKNRQLREKVQELRKKVIDKLTEKHAAHELSLRQTESVPHESSYEAELAKNRALRAQVHDLRAKVIKKLSEKHAAHELSLRQTQPTEHESHDPAYQAELSKNRQLREKVQELRKKVIDKLTEKHAAHELSLRQTSDVVHENNLNALFEKEKQRNVYLKQKVNELRTKKQDLLRKKEEERADKEIEELVEELSFQQNDVAAPTAAKSTGSLAAVGAVGLAAVLAGASFLASQEGASPTTALEDRQ